MISLDFKLQAGIIPTMAITTGRDERTQHKPLVALKRWMDERDLTQCEFAEILGVTQGQVSKYLSGHRCLPAETVLRVSHLTGIEAERLSNNARTTRLLKLLGTRTTPSTKTLNDHVRVV